MEGLDNEGKDLDGAGGGESGSGLGAGLEAFGEEKNLPTLCWDFSGLALILTLRYCLGDKSCCSPSITLMVDISSSAPDYVGSMGKWQGPGKS